MDDFTEFLHHLLYEGRLLVRLERLDVTPTASAEELLAQTFERYRLDLAGPPIEFEPSVALAASQLLWGSAIALVDHSEAPSALAYGLTMHRPPRTPSEHLSGDLLLRFLPQIHRRARASNPVDPLLDLLAQVLCQWPLSGVLAGLEQSPTSPLGFSGHHGLLMLYAERWLQHQKTSWRSEGITEEYLEWILNDRNQGELVSRNLRSGSIG